MAKDSGFRKTAAKNFGKMMSVFGETMSEVLEDPALREKALKFSQEVMDSAARVAASKVEDDELRDKFRKVGKAAQVLGKSVTEHFEAEKK